MAASFRKIATKTTLFAGTTTISSSTRRLSPTWKASSVKIYCSVQSAGNLGKGSSETIRVGPSLAPIIWMRSTLFYDKVRQGQDRVQIKHPEVTNVGLVTPLFAGTTSLLSFKYSRAHDAIVKTLKR